MNIKKLGWVYTQYAPNEFQWMKFNKVGKCIAIEGDFIWKQDNNG